MPDYLRISATFLDPRFHGRGDGGEPEWPPSPLRLMQAIVAANADRLDADGDLCGAIERLEAQSPPLIITPRHERAAPYLLSVPNNAMDIVARAWSRGNYFGGGDASPATHRTMKMVRPVRMTDGDTVHYLWHLDDWSAVDAPLFEELTEAARRVVALGWGIDLVVAYAGRVPGTEVRGLRGERWLPTTPTSARALRTPTSGTLRDLQQRHAAFLDRIDASGFVPVPPLTRFNITGYQRPKDPVHRPYAVFELRHDDGSFCRYPQRKLAHISGMVRHVAREAMQKSPPQNVPTDWVERYVAGHRDECAQHHEQFSYLPLPSIGHHHADQAVRRVMIAAPVGTDVWLEHLVQRMRGQQLIPENGDAFGDEGPPSLLRVHRDKVARHYTAPANRWASVTPVILPGHDDRKPAKTRKLIEKALAQSGLDQPCTFEWSTFSRFRHSLSAHKYHTDGDTGDKRWQFENVKGYLRGKTWVHLILTFTNGLELPGPLCVGAGRHCGFGLMARLATENDRVLNS